MQNLIQPIINKTITMHPTPIKPGRRIIQKRDISQTSEALLPVKAGTE